MRELAVVALILMSVPAVAAVLPFDAAKRTGGALRLAQGRPFDSVAPIEDARVLAQDEPAVLAGQAASAPAYRGEWTADTYHTWRGDDGEPRVQFNLRSAAGDSRWGFGVRLRDLTGLPPAASSGAVSDVQFSWTREAGSFRFAGSFDDGRGSGTFTFTPDQSFINAMSGLGYRSLSSEDVVRMAMHDVTTAHTRGLAQVGYANLPLEDLIRTRIHRVTPQFVSELAAVGYKNVPIEDLIRMSIHGATAANIKAMQDAGIRGQSVEDVIRFRIHKVTPEFIRAMEQRGYKGVPAEDLVKMRIHKVSPDEVDQLKTLGLGGLSVDELVKFRIHKVTPDYIRSMRDVGFTAASEDQLVRMRIHKVDALFVRHAREDGFTVQTPGEAIDLAIHGPRWKRRR